MPISLFLLSFLNNNNNIHIITTILRITYCDCGCIIAMASTCRNNQSLPFSSPAGEHLPGRDQGFLDTCATLPRALGIQVNGLVQKRVSVGPKKALYDCTGKTGNFWSAAQGSKNIIF